MKSRCHMLSSLSLNPTTRTSELVNDIQMYDSLLESSRFIPRLAISRAYVDETAETFRFRVLLRHSAESELCW